MATTSIRSHQSANRDLIVVIVGPTAAGKTQLSLDVASRFGGEIIAADSRTVYRGLDIGTAKPTVAEQHRVRHHLLDVVAVDQSFSVAQFQDLGRQAITDIQNRGRLPIIVGGSGLYVAALVLGYDFSDQVGPSEQRQIFNQMSLGQLRDLIRDRRLLLPRDSKNRRRLIRVLERGWVSPPGLGRPPGPSFWVGLKPPDAVLRQRIEARFEEMIANGVIDEVRWAVNNCPAGSEPAKGNIYRCLGPHILGQIDLARARSDFIDSDLRLSKKQMGWFRRYEFIDWFEQSGLALDHISARLK